MSSEYGQNATLSYNKYLKVPELIKLQYHHVLMVERMLGMKPGTGGAEGAAYLMTTLSKRFFLEIWEARTHLKL